ncbi:MAG: flagellar M-ring protein FliF, partial [Alphaproteobacteria bacterium]|nr:flagellar M-ring protein FliF [Alphaproteobacteria bacterium]
GVAVGLVAFFIYLATRLATPAMALLYNQLEIVDSGQIVAQLQSQNIPFQVRNNASEILVPSDRVGQLRILMAEQGLPNSGSIGNEIFDKEQTLGSSSFIQNVNKLRALEGELARTIASLTTIRGARVHLVMPRRELFSRDIQESSASIALRMRGSNRLDRNQVLAIQHLVAAAVPRLQPKRISIVDDRGTLLSRGGDGDASGVTRDEMQVAFENRLSAKLTEMLEKIVGFGKVRAEVRADMDFDRIVTKEEIYDPDGQVVRSTQSITETSQEQSGQNDAVSVEQNLPDAQGAGGANGDTSTSSRSEEATNFEISKTIRNHVREAGKVNKMSVAILVDGNYTENAEGVSQYEPRSQQELEQIDRLVRSTVGFDSVRGDTVEIVNLRFAIDPTLEIDLGPGEILGFKQSDLLRLAEIIVLALVGVLVMLLVVRPLITRVFEASAAAADAIAQSTQQQMITDQRLGAEGGEGGVPALPGQAAAAGGALAVAGAMPSVAPALEETMINLNNIEGRVKASSLRKIGEIIDKHPEEAVSIVRTWMYQE